MSYCPCSVSARMRPCGIPANKLGFPHISKHGLPDLALKNHIWPPKNRFARIQPCKGAKLYWTNLHCVRKLKERNRDWVSVFKPVVPYKLSNAQNQS